MTDKTQTPRSSEASFMLGSPKAKILGDEAVVVQFFVAQDLERELAAANSRIAELKQECDDLEQHATSEIGQLKAELAEVQAELNDAARGERHD